MCITLKESLNLIEKIILIVRPEFSDKLKTISYTCLLTSTVLQLSTETKKQFLFSLLKENIYDIHTSNILSSIILFKQNPYLKDSDINKLLLSLQKFFPPPNITPVDNIPYIDYHSIYWISVTSLLLSPSQNSGTEVFDSLLYKLHSPNIAKKIKSQIHNNQNRTIINDFMNKSISMNDLKDVSTIIIAIISLYNPFTAKHSQTVGRISRFLSLKIKETSLYSDKVEIAGLLHDIGKIYVPINILEKQDTLTPVELKCLQSHCVKTREILEHFSKLGDIKLWASNHHEKLDGSGYPQKLTDKSLDLPSRIITVADIFCALTENRPYRSQLSNENALKIMEKNVSSGKLDIYVFNTLKKHVNELGEFID